MPRGLGILFVLAALWASSPGALGVGARRSQVVLSSEEPSTPAREPYRGWSSWSLQAYKGEGYGFLWLNETNIKAQADVVAAELSHLGYDRINVDSGWQGEIDEYGRHMPNERRFASGVPALRSYLGARGLKLGLYYLPGIDDRAVREKTPVLGTPFTADEIVQCAENDASCVRPPANAFSAGTALNFSHPGAQAYVDSIVELLYSWNVSFVKLDATVPGSSIRPSDGTEWTLCDTTADLRAWRDAIERLYPAWESQGREKIWLVASWELPPSMAGNLRRYADSWRVAIDIEAYSREMTTFDRVIRNTKKGALWTSIEKNRGSGLLDLDAVLVSDMTYDEAKSMVTLWALLGSPFYAGDDLTKLNRTRLALLQNPEVLDIQRRSGLNPARLLHYNESASSSVFSIRDVAAIEEKRRWTRRSLGQAPGGSPPPPFHATGLGADSRPEWEQEVWYAEHDNGDVVLSFVNAGELKWWDFPVAMDLDLANLPLRRRSPVYRVRDVWRRKDVGILTSDARFSLDMDRHSSFLWLLRPL